MNKIVLVNQYVLNLLLKLGLSGALSGLMLNLGLLKISLGGVFSYLKPLREALTPRSTILILFLTLSIILRWNILPGSAPDPNYLFKVWKASKIFAQL